MATKPVLPRAWLAALWLALLSALLLAQTLGLVHRIVHAPQFGHATQARHSDAHTVGDILQSVQSVQGVMAPLFSGHGDASECRLYDQLGNGQPMPSVPVLVVPVVIPFFVLEFFQGEAVARWAALFDARGPPSVR